MLAQESTIITLYRKVSTNSWKRIDCVPFLAVSVKASCCLKSSHHTSLMIIGNPINLMEPVAIFFTPPVRRIEDWTGAWWLSSVSEQQSGFGRRSRYSTPWIWRDGRWWMVVVCYRWSDSIALVYPCCLTSLNLRVKRIWIWKFERHGLWNSPVLLRRVNTAIKVDHMVMIFMSSTQPSRAWIWIDDRQWMVKIGVLYLITS